VSTPCADCGGRFGWRFMHFDHVRGTKRFDISQAFRGHRGGGGLSVAGFSKPWSEADVWVEIEKCDVVCANCHAIRGHRRHRNRIVLR
jgi:hypothetical protein